MAKYGLLIDYEFCTGCKACEIACKQEQNLPIGKWGIKVYQIGPVQIGSDKWAFDYIPVPTDFCNLCSERVEKAQKPACVKHCMAGVMKFASIKELAKFMELKSKTVMFVPR